MDSTQDTEDADETAPLLDSTRQPEHNTFTPSANGQRDNPPTGKETSTSSLWWAPFEKIYDVFRKMTWKLFFIWMLTSVLNIMFGYDSTSFSGLQNIPSFAREFGTPNSSDGSYGLSASRASFMSSVGFAGKLLGTLVCAFLTFVFQRSSCLLTTISRQRRYQSSVWVTSPQYSWHA